MVGMLAIGLVAGAGIGGYAVSQRSHMKRPSEYADRMGDEMSGPDGDDDNPVAVTRRRSNHRPKTTSEVSETDPPRAHSRIDIPSFRSRGPALPETSYLLHPLSWRSRHSGANGRAWLQFPHIDR